MPRVRPTKEVDGVTWWWCNRNRHFAPPDNFHLNKNGKLASTCRPCDNARCRDESEKRSAYCKTWRTANRFTLLVKKREYHFKFSEKHKAISRAWYEANREYALKRTRRYKEQNKDRVYIHNALRQHRMKNATGSFTLEQWLAKCAYFGWCCYLCGVDLTRKTAIKEHRKPIARGGSNWIANIAPACKRCNLKKGTSTETEHRARKAVRLTLHA